MGESINDRRPDVDVRRLISKDGTPITYHVMGAKGGSPVLLVNGAGARYDSWRHIVSRYGDKHRFYCWDYRGTYGSGRPIAGYGGLRIEDHANDGLALLEREGIEDCVAMGWSSGTQILVEMSKVAHERISAMVLLNGVAGAPFQTFGGNEKLGSLVESSLDYAQGFDRFLLKTLSLALENRFFLPTLQKLGLLHSNAEREFFLQMARNFRGLDLHLYIELIKKMGEHDARHALTELDCPLLVLVSPKDPLVPISVAREMAAAAPKGRLKVLPGGTHFALAEFPGQINEAIASIFRGNLIPGASPA